MKLLLFLGEASDDGEYMPEAKFLKSHQQIQGDEDEKERGTSAQKRAGRKRKKTRGRNSKKSAKLVGYI